ncbi:uncharacterized protein LOC125241309 [Leguminivora glycinivorella]|uniref:uncharacterized protein LOC125241309 n=1 Tax=Leguminivora glycinivorella TaxID=1035111 RepID=UPI00200EBC78|nr:uncharacterized protein LOC125241309 [Leguminivora glycinivorella]XP_048005677.1 uncharacterized protein LOC125241309 [Leguminivora glycinivorella]
MALVALLLLHVGITIAINCSRAKAPFELGEWNGHLEHLDAATIENNPVTAAEGQFYVYENTFPRHTIKYLQVDNLAQKTCGAVATLKRGGLNTSSLLLILHAESSQEIRSVVDVWGVPKMVPRKRNVKPLEREGDLKNMQSKYLFMKARALNHNSWSDSPSDTETESNI